MRNKALTKELLAVYANYAFDFNSFHPLLCFVTLSLSQSQKALIQEPVNYEVYSNDSHAGCKN